MAHLSGDPHMIEAFQKGQDIHAATAAKIYKEKLEDVTREQRSKAKTANFGIIYGISVFGLAERLNIERKEAKELIDGYFENYPHVKEYMIKVSVWHKKKDISKLYSSVSATCLISIHAMLWSVGMQNETQSMLLYKEVLLILSKWQ